MSGGATARRRALPGSAGVRLSALEWRRAGDPEAGDSGLDGPSAPVRAAGGASRPGSVEPPILFHHGLASSAGFWGLVGARLATPDPGWSPGDIVAIDARGHGESDRPAEGYDFATVTADLHAALDALGWADSSGRRPLLVGHSWGGNVVLEYAARHPGVPAGLALVDGGFIELQAHMSWEETERELAPPRLEPMTWPEFAARAATWWRATGWDAGVEAAVRHNFEEMPDGTIRARLPRDAHMRILRALWEQQPSQLYRHVRCPVLVLPARRAAADGRERRFIERKEQAVRQAVEILRDGGVRVETEWFDDSIHDIPLQHPARLAARLAAFATSLS